MTPLLRTLAVLCLGLSLTACGGDSTASGTGGETGEAAHVHGPDCDHDTEAAGPHGGAMATVGDSAARLEALHDDVLGQVTVYVLDEEDGMLTLDQPPVLSLVTDDGSLQLKPTQIGGAWVFESDDLLDEPEKARFRIALAGKTWTVDMPCSHGHEHDGHEHGEGHEDEHGHHADDGDGHDDDHHD